MPDELVDLLNDKGERLGKTVMKSEAHASSLWHPTMHLWLFNKEKGVLIQKRAPKKRLLPNRWDISVAGHIASGENSVDVAVREAKEELGLNLNKKLLIKLFTSLKQSNLAEPPNRENVFADVFGYELSHVPKFVLQEDEVGEVKFVSFDELIKILSDDSDAYGFVPNKTRLLKEVVELKNRVLK